jgi:hypothetical protein
MQGIGKYVIINLNTNSDKTSQYVFISVSTNADNKPTMRL